MMRVLAALLLAAATCSTWAAAPVSIETRMKRMEDQAAIERVLLEYGRTLDARDFKAYAALFAAEGEWKGGFGTFKGPQAIQEAMERTFSTPAATADVPRGRNFHVMSNFIIDIQGDRATARSMFVFYRMEGNEPKAAVAGRYEDVLVRENGEWKFLVRNALPPD